MRHKVTAQATREGHLWIVEIPEYDLMTQARSVAEIPEMAADLVAITLDVSPEDVEVTVSKRH